MLIVNNIIKNNNNFYFNENVKITILSEKEIDVQDNDKNIIRAFR